MSDKHKPQRPGASNASTGGNNAAAVPEGNVDQIRDILFGGQMRDYERRFLELEERIRREADKLRADLLKRMEHLEALGREQHEQLQTQAQRSDRDRREAEDSLEQRLQAQGKSLKADLLALEQKQDHDVQQLRDRLHRSNNEAAEALRERAEELLAELQRVGTQLRDDKVARQELAGFFSEMALRLNHEFDLPQAGPRG
jgi:DNA anti-recombination protein RmuC